MTRIFSCTTPFAIDEIWLNFQISPKSIAYHPIKHSDCLLGDMEAGRRRRMLTENVVGAASQNHQNGTIIVIKWRLRKKNMFLKTKSKTRGKEFIFN